MKYKAFLIDVFEQEPGRWHAQITRPHGRPLKSTNRIREFVTSAEHSSAAQALMKAMEVIDAGYFSHDTERSTEKFWRRLSKPGRLLGVVTNRKIESVREP
jgi:hypothetical protein